MGTLALGLLPLVVPLSRVKDMAPSPLPRPQDRAHILDMVHSSSLLVIQEDKDLFQEDLVLIQEDLVLIQEDLVLIQEDLVLIQEDLVLIQEVLVLIQEDLVLIQEDKDLFQEGKVLFQEDKVLIQEDRVHIWEDKVSWLCTCYVSKMLCNTILFSNEGRRSGIATEQVDARQCSDIEGIIG